MPRERRAPVVKPDPAAPVKDEPAPQPDLAPAPRSSSRTDFLPAPAKMPVAVLLSFALEAVGYMALGDATRGELLGLTRSLETWGEVGVLAGWKAVELALGWYGGLDSLDVAALYLLSHGPHFYLLSTFYSLSPVVAVSALGIDIISVAVPFYLLRPLSAFHSSSAPLPNRELISLPLQLYTTALSTGIYTVVLVLSMRFILPRVLVVYFSGLPTLEPAYTASYAAVLPTTLLFGAAASTFIFAPFATTGHVKEDDKIAEFDPVKATLGQTVWWNVWGYTAKTKVVIRRTAIAVVISTISTYIGLTLSVYGIQGTGALAYGGVWAFAALCSGIGLGFVGGE